MSMRSEHRWQVLRYLVVGSFNTAASYSIYCVLLWLGSSIALASLGSIVFGICLSFVTLGKLVFMRQLQGRFPRFVLSWIFLYAFNLALIVLVMRLGVGPYVGGLLAGIMTAAVSFLVQRNYVYR